MMAPDDLLTVGAPLQDLLEEHGIRLGVHLRATKGPSPQSEDMDKDEVVPHLAEKVSQDLVVEDSHCAPRKGRTVHSVCALRPIHSTCC
mmetsp:Transcript_10689/g.26652  ORF Transcript_10689/g.26652 Transcript_10689/m.26652 type:complete len:89 (-) Transcript_10689:101-367(-)